MIDDLDAGNMLGVIFLETISSKNALMRKVGYVLMRSEMSCFILVDEWHLRNQMEYIRLNGEKELLVRTSIYLFETLFKECFPRIPCDSYESW